MPLNVFICWSGRRGKLAANALREWLGDALGPLVEVRVSSGMEKGVLWHEELATFLSAADVGLICMTPEALKSSWVNYEAGFMSREVARAALACDGRPLGGPVRRLFTFLWGVTEAELTGPLAAFQSTNAADERDVSRMVDALASLASSKTPEGPAAKPQGKWSELWQDLCDRLESIPAARLPEICPDFEALFRRKTFEEATEDCVDQRWLDRYDGARDTLAAIRERRRGVERACRPSAVDLYRALEQEVDGYGMAVSMLVRGPRFELDDAGHVMIAPKGLIATCEARRRRIRELVAGLVDPRQAPFFNEAVRYRAAEAQAEQRNLIHQLTPAIDQLATKVSRGRLPESWPADAFCFTLFKVSLRGKPQKSDERGPTISLDTQWRTSEWDLDRIMYAVFLEKSIELANDPTELCDKALELAELELEKIEAQDPAPVPAGSPQAPRPHSSLMPLEYMVSPLRNIDKAKHELRLARISGLVDRVNALLDKRNVEADRSLRRTMLEVGRKLAALTPPQKSPIASPRPSPAPSV
jgi:hypothetical protein